MSCLKFNAKSTQAATKAVEKLRKLGVREILTDNNSLCVVFWSDNTFCAVTEHEYDESTLADCTVFYTKRKEFIAAVKREL